MRPVAIATLLTLLLFSPTFAFAQPRDGDEAKASPLDTDALHGLEWRSIGPALMGGRISDIEIDPRHSGTWYVSAGSGGVWKTQNAGVTWTPIFDAQPSYSIGCVTLDPSYPDVVWVGTGENVSGRHVGWGDGVYKSLDGGKTWKRMGLESSEHIGDVIVDPRDGNVVWVAAQGPLWSAGGERGLFKTVDGGETWRNVLDLGEDTGVTDVEIDPRDPDVLYAASYQRRRSVWALLHGPGSGIHKSTDGGETWKRLERGLPKGDMGKIGLAVSPADPDVVYATIEASEEEKGFYRSRDRGESWEKRNPYISGGTGPHYYQEIVASPHDVDRVYQMDVFIHVTEDGGGHFDYLASGSEKHSDNHAMAIDPLNPDRLLAGTDAGLYETFDHGKTWRHFPNMPISQFYRLALDNASPFYNILGGAQDLGTLYGPSRTRNTEGVRNRDWYVPLGADGYACAFDPDEPDLFYIQWQGGRLHRYDKKSEEALDIRPQPEPGDPPERFNWDSPVIISPHDTKRLYYGSQRLWRSDDRGDSWRAVSGDLSRGQNRYEMEMMGRVWSVDALYGNTAMSLYGTLTTIDESPLVEGLLYAGTDDGLVQVSEDGGDSWRIGGKWPVSDVPELVFVNDVVASLHDVDTVFVALDAHKFGDFRPLLFLSRDRGRTWSSISGLPENHVVWSIAQDHVEKDLLFAGTEYGVLFTPDGGGRWIELSAGMPTIASREIAIQRRDDDLVAATFGRGFYVLDDYSVLREIAAGALEGDATLFPVRDAWWFVPYVPGQARGIPTLGSDSYTAPNPPHGAVFTYHLEQDRQTARDERREGERELREAGADVPFPGWERLGEETFEQEPKVFLLVRDEAGRAVRRLEGPAKAGVHRVAWDLRRPAPNPVNLEPVGFRPPWVEDPRGPLAPPGSYSVEMALLQNGQLEPVGEPRTFRVEPVPGTVLETPDFQAVADFQAETAELMRQVQGAATEISDAEERIRHLRPALAVAPRTTPELFERLARIEADLAALLERLSGDRARQHYNESSAPAIMDRVFQVTFGHWDTRQAPTATQRRNLELAEKAFAEVRGELETLVRETLSTFETALEDAGAPPTPGRRLPRH